jgi:hypothetical protein
VGRGFFPSSPGRVANNNDTNTNTNTNAVQIDRRILTHSPTSALGASSPTTNTLIVAVLFFSRACVATCGRHWRYPISGNHLPKRMPGSLG